MKKSEGQKEINKALAALQGELCTVEKAGTNPHFHSRFTRLEDAVRAAAPIASKHGLSVSQWLEGPSGLTTELAHVSGEWKESTSEIEAERKGPQARGSAVTYARRYAYLAALGLAPADDDAEGATERSAPQAAPQPHQGPPEREPGNATGPWDYVLPITKNKGKRLGDLTDQQLDWYADDCNHEEVKRMANAERDARKGSE